MTVEPSPLDLASAELGSNTCLTDEMSHSRLQSGSAGVVCLPHKWVTRWKSCLTSNFLPSKFFSVLAFSLSDSWGLRKKRLSLDQDAWRFMWLHIGTLSVARGQCHWYHLSMAFLIKWSGCNNTPWLGRNHGHLATCMGEKKSASDRLTKWVYM